MTLSMLPKYLLLSFFLNIIFQFILIRTFKTWSFFQPIRETFIKRHQDTKAFTPTMGGIGIIASFLIPFLLFPFDHKLHLLAVLLLPIAFGIIGYLDDFGKLMSKSAYGLSGKKRLLIEFMIACVSTVLLLQMGIINTEILLPVAFYKTITLDLGYLFIPFVMFFIVATANSVNLTDGLDGLVSTQLLVCLFTFGLIGNSIAPNDISMIIIFTLSGALLGFLVYNFHPAKIFMGDVGSLFTGGLLATVAVLFKLEIAMLVVGFLIFLESVSVIIQVSFFKRTGKRVFKMAPIHHHFELCGLSEKAIVLYGICITSALGGLSYIAFL